MFILKNDLLYYLKNLDIGGFLMKLIRYLFLIIDSVIYGFISYAYQMFSFMSQIRIFENDEMKDIANRVYILIGVIAMFFVAYALICAIINPENATKGKNSSVTGIVKNIIFAIIGIAIVPSIFNYAYDFQKTVLCSNLIEKLFLGNDVNGDTDSNANMGNQLELLLFKSFYYIANYEEDTGDGTTIGNTNGVDDSVWATVAKNITNYNNNKSLYDAFQSIESGEGSISEELNGFDVSIHEGTIKYLFLLSTIAGLYCAYVLLGFVIDMGVRSVKLAYLQLIAPLPIFSMVIPGQKKVFDNWLKKTTSCFMEVFVRVIAMTFAFYAIKYLRPWIFGNGMNEVICGANTIGGTTKLLAQAVYILGIFAFLKQLPKFISDLLPGFDSKGFKLGLGNALAETGGLQMLGAAGGALTSGIRNGSMAVKGFKETKGSAWSKRARAALGGIGSTVAGFASGGARSFVKGKEAKKWSDVAKFAGEGADAATEAKFKRQEYNDLHNDGEPLWRTRAHLSDAKDKIGSFLSPAEAQYKHLQNVLKPVNETADSGKAMMDAAKDYVSNHEKDIRVTNFKFTDADGIEHEIKDNDQYSLAKFKQVWEDAEKTANSTGNRIDIDYARSAKAQYDAAVKAAQIGALAGQYGTDDNGNIDGEIYAKIQTYQSNLRKNRDIILSNSGYDESSLRYKNFAESLDNIINLDLSKKSNLNTFVTFTEQLKRKDNNDIEVGSFEASKTAKNNISAQSGALLDKINEQKDKK